MKKSINEIIKEYEQSVVKEYDTENLAKEIIALFDELEREIKEIETRYEKKENEIVNNPIKRKAV